VARTGADVWSEAAWSWKLKLGGHGNSFYSETIFANGLVKVPKNSLVYLGL